MKLKKTISLLLAVSALVGNMSAMNVFAEGNNGDVLYSYITEDGNTVNVTQADLDAEHWNYAALGDVPTNVYADFPMEIEKFVDDYSNIQLALTYLKLLGSSDSANLKIIDIFDDNEIASYDINDAFMYTDALEAGRDYALVLTETIDGETNEYYKEVTVQNVSAEMPDYITDAPEDCESTVLVGNIADLKSSESIDEDGNIVIDSTMKRYEKVAASEFASYCNTLSDDAIYKIYTKDENDNRYTGFISTYEGGSDLGIYMPDITVRKWETYMSPSVCAISSSQITASMIKNATKINMTHFRDYSFAIKDTKSKIKVFAWQVPTGYMEYDVGFTLKGHMDASFAMDVWRASSLTATPVKCKSYGTSKSINKHLLAETYSGVSEGDYLFFVLYLPSATSSHGVLDIETDDYPSEDISGSAYDAYTSGGAVTMSATTYKLYDSLDADTFYINYTSSTPQNYRARLDNRPEDNLNNQVEKAMELSYYANQTSYFSASNAPDDIITVPIDDALNYTFQVHADMQAFLTVYDTETMTKSSRYKLSYIQK